MRGEPVVKLASLLACSITAPSKQSFRLVRPVRPCRMVSGGSSRVHGPCRRHRLSEALVKPTFPLARITPFFWWAKRWWYPH
eukprot:6207883-Pleurochrysis_carterae.AAC.3